jgi:hypothetical protein
MVSGNVRMGSRLLLIPAIMQQGSMAKFDFSINGISHIEHVVVLLCLHLRLAVPVGRLLVVLKQVHFVLTIHLGRGVKAWAGLDRLSIEVDCHG